MRERWDSRRCFERHLITLQAATIAVNASERSHACNAVILQDYIYFLSCNCWLVKDSDRNLCLCSSSWINAPAAIVWVDSFPVMRNFHRRGRERSQDR